MQKQPIYRAISSALAARINCEKNGNTEWHAKHAEKIKSLVKEHAPSGSGFDAGTKFDFDASTPEKLVFTTAYHHMHESGMYDGWTEHRVTVRPSLMYGYNLTISGRDRNGFKEYAHEVFSHFLSIEV